jgi:hypothetical protein
MDLAATYQKFQALRESIAHLRVRDKRSLFLLMRTAADQLTVDTFFPTYGFTAGEFAVGQVLSENNRKPTAHDTAMQTTTTPNPIQPMPTSTPRLRTLPLVTRQGQMVRQKRSGT